METSYVEREITTTATSTNSPRITPTRRSLDNHFPQLAFTILTNGKPYFEVLLTTDPILFDAQHAADRTTGNFYPIRAEDRHLIQASAGSAVFIVPQAALHSFATSTPRPKAIYYTLVSYADASGGQPTFAQPIETLPTNAPSVLLSADFRAETLSSVLGIPVSRLRRVQTGSAFTSKDLLSLESDLSIVDDDFTTTTPDDASHQTGIKPEDGYESYHTVVSPTPQSLDDGFEDSIADWPSLDKDPSLNQPQSATKVDYPADDLTEQKPYAMPQESRFPSGTPEPTALLDSEEPWNNGDANDANALTYDDGFGEFTPESAADNPVDDNSSSDIPSLLTDDDKGEFDDYEAQEFANNNNSSNGTNRYRDEADDYAYEESFAVAEANDIFEPEIPYEPLSSITLGGGNVTAMPLTIDAQRAIIERIAHFESGTKGYSAMNRDGEFRGRFGQNHPAYNRYHIGLSYGVIQFTQDSGNLGRLLTMMRDRDHTRFDAIFGPDAEMLIRVTTAAGPGSAKSANGRSARVQPISGADLWEEPWISRFTQAGQHVPFQAAQNELAAQLYITPILPFARWLGLTTDRALTIVVDRAVQMGVGGARAWIIRVVGPIRTAAQRQQALAALSHADLRSFQRATPGLADDGVWGPQSHAALVFALRALGSASPIEIPTRDQMLDAMVRQSSSERWGHRVQTLHDATNFSDTVYDF